MCRRRETAFERETKWRHFWFPGRRSGFDCWLNLGQYTASRGARLRRTHRDVARGPPRGAEARAVRSADHAGRRPGAGGDPSTTTSPSPLLAQRASQGESAARAHPERRPAADRAGRHEAKGEVGDIVAWARVPGGCRRRRTVVLLGGRFGRGPQGRRWERCAREEGFIAHEEDRARDEDGARARARGDGGGRGRLPGRRRAAHAGPRSPGYEDRDHRGGVQG